MSLAWLRLGEHDAVCAAQFSRRHFFFAGPHEVGLGSMRVTRGEGQRKVVPIVGAPSPYLNLDLASGCTELPVADATTSVADVGPNVPRRTGRASEKQ
jgi:hypothetical protein